MSNKLGFFEPKLHCCYDTSVASHYVHRSVILIVTVRSFDILFSHYFKRSVNSVFNL
jgi:hypothetical protein